MPRRICGQCGRTITISQRDWKYQNDSTMFLCSKSCVVENIKSFKTNPTVKYSPSPITGMILGDVIYSKKFNINFKSKYELKFAEFLNSSSFDFLYEPYGFDIDGHNYTPDFYITAHDCFIEVKGLFRSGSKGRLKKFIKQYPDINFVFIPWTLRKEFYANPK